MTDNITFFRALCMFCEENFGKINAKGVDKFFRNGYVHEFYRLKAFITLLGSLVECGKLSLYAYGSRDEHDKIGRASCRERV